MTQKIFHLLLILAVFQTITGAQEFERDSLFDSDWKFYRGTLTGAQDPNFDDKTWRDVTLPHDWSIEDLPVPEVTAASRVVSGPFDSQAPHGDSTAFTLGGVGWYRRHFMMPREAAGKTVMVQFDGVYMDAEVWINGQPLGQHPYGYTPFVFDLTQYLHFGDEENVLAVCVRNEGFNSRWYSGSGIYRHVWFKVLEPLHIAPWGCFVATPQVDANLARVRIATDLANNTGKRTDVQLVASILDTEAKVVASSRIETRLSEQTPTTIEQTLDVSHPRLWSPESPVLYRLVCELMQEDKIMDRSETVFGIRSIEFDTARGFFLNGQNIKLKGGCVHANNGPLGAAALDRAEERRVELLKAAGFNAVRCAHNPPSPAFLDACDRVGMMVIDELCDEWTVSHPPATGGYHRYFQNWWQQDLDSMIRRDRNHPSLILWSIGNQIRNSASDTGARIARQVAAATRTLDHTRPVTSNVLRWSGDWRDLDPFFAALDVAGYSYARAHYDEDHERLPNRVIFSSEIDPANCFGNWMAVLDRDFVCGNFAWTSFDYMGEVGLGWWSYGHSAAELFPWIVNYSGDLDICGFRRPRSYYREVLWNDKPAVFAFVHSPVPSFPGPGRSNWGWDDVKPSWTWPGYEGKDMTVVAYSACESVQLLLNDKVIGKKATSRDTEFKATWVVPYEKGILKAIGYNKNTQAAQWQLVTAGEPAKIRLIPDRKTIKADGRDLSYVTVEVTDENGILNPNFNDLINFNIEGEGKIVAVGNSNPTSVESFKQPYRKAYEGKCLVVIQSESKPGGIKLAATGKGLVSGGVTIDAK